MGKSKYAGLNCFVQRQIPTELEFQIIAAFLNDWEAIEFAKESSKSAPDQRFRFRVVRYQSNEPKCIYRSDVNGTA